MLERFGINRRELAVLACLVLLVAVTPAGKEATDPLVLGLYRTLLLAIIVLHAGWRDRPRLRPLSPYFLGALAVLVSIMLISLLRWDGSLFEGFYVFYENLLFIAAFVLLARAGPQRPQAWRHAVLWSVVLIGAGYIGGTMLLGQRPLLGPFINPNYLASFVLPGLAVCTAVVCLGSSRLLRIAAAGAGLFLYYGIGQTASRGATLAALALVGLGGFRAARRQGISRSRIAIAACLLLTLTLIMNPVLISKFLDRGENDPYNYERGQIWLGTLEMIGENPLTGVGLGHYAYIAKLFTPRVENTIARYRKFPNIAHSEYLQYMAEIGVPGALLLFALGGYLFLLAWRRAEPGAPRENCIVQESALLAAAGLAAHAVVDNNWTVPVMAAGLAVISQADLLPYGRDYRRTLQWTQWRSVLALLLIAVWIDAALIPSIGFYFNENGHEAHEADDFERAEVNHRFALAFIPRHPVLLDNLGIVYFDQFMKTHKIEYLDRAEGLFSDSMKENPHFDVPAGHLESALIQRLTGDPRKDLPIHRKIIETDEHLLAVNPFNPFIRKNLAEAFYNIGDHEQACAELLKAVEIEPNYVPGYLRLAEWYEKAGQRVKSDKYRNRAIQVVNFYKDKPSLDPFEDLLLGRPPSGEQP